MSIRLLKTMFTEMVEKKNAALIPAYYHPAFELYANGKHQDYQTFLTFHEKVYQTDIQYHVRYDETTCVEQSDKVALRVFFTITQPNVPTRELEVILICQFKDSKIFRVWELCYPDWTKMSVFQPE